MEYIDTTFCNEDGSFGLCGFLVRVRKSEKVIGITSSILVEGNKETSKIFMRKEKCEMCCHLLGEIDICETIFKISKNEKESRSFGRLAIFACDNNFQNENMRWRSVETRAHLGGLIKDNTLKLLYNDWTFGYNILQELDFGMGVTQFCAERSDVVALRLTPKAPRNSNGALLVNSDKCPVGIVVYTKVQDNTTYAVCFGVVMKALLSLDSVKMFTQEKPEKQNENIETVIQCTLNSKQPRVFKMSANGRCSTCAPIYSLNGSTLFVSAAHSLGYKDVDVEVVDVETNTIYKSKRIFYSWCFDVVFVTIEKTFSIFEISTEISKTAFFLGFGASSQDVTLQPTKIYSIASQNNNDFICCCEGCVSEGMSGGVLLQNNSIYGLILSSDDDFSFCLCGAFIHKIVSLLQTKTEEEIQIELMGYGVVNEAIDGVGDYYEYRKIN
ncbi:hypothetical protein EIN_249230 [Entamoeba invadens IP1]|uniref:Peptidase S1 domain-containing protein n=1 Tax=Entamoeba invadens IP1 TaxID=370355 RepID=A0A0A1UGG7_ENTIV|nr:hypothetical protein EIN_249230 [Entamoeba invadens IP1]ELP94889.1 hypothetical protein EIN_249230 [Entamoeba invadens IP1]|eukprot:XP_004261660.1 hypothetical protein EIN_249230 [Entamoeba invadens IP1]